MPLFPAVPGPWEKSCPSDADQLEWLNKAARASPPVVGEGVRFSCSFLFPSTCDPGSVHAHV